MLTTRDTYKMIHSFIRANKSAADESTVRMYMLGVSNMRKLTNKWDIPMLDMSAHNWGWEWSESRKCRTVFRGTLTGRRFFQSL